MFDPIIGFGKPGVSSYGCSMKLIKFYGFKFLTIYLNTNSLCIEAHHGAKSTLGKLENWTAIVVSYGKFWDHVAIPGEQLGANMLQ
jgi:hypothetical protein